MEKKIYKGYISKHTHGEADDILFLSSVSDPLAEELEFLTGKSVSMRYWVCENKCTKEEAITDILGKLDGVADIRFCHRYSYYTGYLWTDEDLNVGGHDLLGELGNYVDKWLILEVDY